MKILLLHPPNKEVYSKFQRGVLKRLPIGLAYIAALVKKEGYDSEVLDAEALSLGVKESAEAILEKNIDIVGITATTPLVTIASEIAKAIKKKRPYIKIILGGPHASAVPRETLNQFEDLDYVVFGEGEVSLSELLKAISQNRQPYGVAGVGFRSKDKIIINKNRELINNLDAIEFPPREFFPNDKYLDPQNFSGIYTLVVTSRGCPYRCIFCGSVSVWGKTIRFRSPKNILDELELIVKEFNIRNIYFTDDTFTLNKERVIKICEGIIKRKLRINFHCSSRADTIDEDRLKLLKKAGCQIIGFGFESGDNRILKTVKKGIDVNDILYAAKLTREYGIKIFATYMIGNPGETNETIKKTIDLALKLKTERTQFAITTPFPGTELWTMAKSQNKLRHQDFSQYYWYYSVVANMTTLSDKELMDWQRYAYRKLEEAGGHG